MDQKNIIEDLIASMDDNNKGFRKDIDTCNNEITLIQEEKIKNNMPAVPGEEILKMMDKWNQNIEDDGMTDKEIRSYANELTMSLE